MFGIRNDVPVSKVFQTGDAFSFFSADPNFVLQLRKAVKLYFARVYYCLASDMTSPYFNFTMIPMDFNVCVSVVLIVIDPQCVFQLFSFGSFSGDPRGPA